MIFIERTCYDYFCISIFYIYILKTVFYGMYEIKKNNNKFGGFIIIIISVVVLFLPSYMVYIR